MSTPFDNSNNNYHNPSTRCPSLAVLGTMSDAGKTTIVAGICRILSNEGVRVAPFKAQNMSNNAQPALLPNSTRRKRLYESFEAAVTIDRQQQQQQQRAPQETSSSSLSSRSSGRKSDNGNDSDKEGGGYGEIGTAQALQAEACRLVPRVEMNPLLLKSGGRNEKGEYLCSVVMLGKQIVRETYGDLGERTTSLQRMVLESHDALAEATDAEVIVIEGAGSCTELNLMNRDIVNLPLVRRLNCPWILVSNIDCGGVFAQIVGTKACVSERDWSLCVGVIVNRLRGEAKYFEPGPQMLQDMIQKPIFVVPYLNDLNLPEEDGLGVERRLAWETKTRTSDDDNNTQSASDNNNDKKEKPLVVVVAYPYVAISDDLIPLECDKRFRVEWRRRRIPERTYPHTTAVILPGSRLTRLDLKWMNDSGWSTYIQKHAASGGTVLGICGGYQMLGQTIDDPTAAEGQHKEKEDKAIGLLPIVTTLEPAECKIVRPQRGKLIPSNIPVEGFELHCGRSKKIEEEYTSTKLLNATPCKIQPLLDFDDDDKPEGMIVGNVKGTYLHGLLRSSRAREELLLTEERRKNFPQEEVDIIQDPLDKLADHLVSCGLDCDTLKDMIGI